MSLPKIPGLQFRNNKIRIDKVVEGVRIYRTLDTTDAVLAQKIMARLVNDALERRYLPGRGGSTTVKAVIDEYWKGHIMHKKYAYYTRFILDAVARRLGDMKIESITRADIGKYIRERLADPKRNGGDGGISPRTVQMELQHLSMAINFAVDNRRLGANPIKRLIYVAQTMPKKIVLDDGREDGEEWRAIIGAVGGRSKQIVQTLYETAMRPGECLRMRWSWITRRENNRCIITVPPSASKTGFEHDIPVSARLLELLESMGMRNSNSLVFPSPQGDDAPRRGVYDAFSRALRKCGLAGRGISPYALRRTRITIWDAIDTNAARYAAGHAPRDIHLRHYVKIHADRLFKLVGM